MNEYFNKTLLVIFLVIIMILLIVWSIIFIAIDTSKDRCEEVGGIHQSGSTVCYKTINGDYVKGEVVKLNGEWVFART